MKDTQPFLTHAGRLLLENKTGICSAYPTPLVEDPAITPSVYLYLLCYRVVDHTTKVLFLGSPFCSLIYVSALCQYHIVLIVGAL